jgi:hypothetical protein
MDPRIILKKVVALTGWSAIFLGKGESDMQPTTLTIPTDPYKPDLLFNVINLLSFPLQILGTGILTRYIRPGTDSPFVTSKSCVPFGQQNGAASGSISTNAHRGKRPLMGYFVLCS